MTEETYLREQLAYLHRSYSEAAKPYIDGLVRLRCLEVSQPVLLGALAGPRIADAWGVVLDGRIVFASISESEAKDMADCTAGHTTIRALMLAAAPTPRAD